MPAAILAGGGGEDGLANGAGAPCRALVEFAGRPMIAWVAEALAEAGTVSDVVAVEGPSRTLSGNAWSGLPVVTAQGPGFIDTMAAGVAAFPEAERVLVATADLPLLTPLAIDGFVRSCHEAESGLSYPMVEAEAFEIAFPGRDKTIARLREGRFTGGNLAVVTRRFVLEQGPVIARTFSRRKSPIGLARIFGLGFVVRLLLGRLKVEDLERRGAEIIGAGVSAVSVPWPEIGFDVDDAEDLELAYRFLEERSVDA